MAILQQPISTNNPFADQIGEDLAPAGTFVATVLDAKDEFGVKRTRFQSTEVETVDLTCFLLGFRDAHGVPHKIASRQMKISGNEKSALFTFLKSMLGRAPEYGWDYCTLKGHQCLITVEHIQRRDGGGMFAGIASLSPVPATVGTTPPVQPASQPLPQAAPAVAAPVPQPSTAPAEDDVPF